MWYGCHAGSVIESTLNPADSTQQMNFLTTTGLVNFSQHSNPSTPYNYRFPTNPEMQFMGTIDAAVTNGSEQVYLPKLGGGWRSSTSVAVWDPTDPDVPLKSPGDAPFNRNFVEVNQVPDHPPGLKSIIIGLWYNTHVNNKRACGYGFNTCKCSMYIEDNS